MKPTERDVSSCLAASLSGLSTNMIRVLYTHIHTHTHRSSPRGSVCLADDLLEMGRTPSRRWSALVGVHTCMHVLSSLRKAAEGCE